MILCPHVALGGAARTGPRLARTLLLLATLVTIVGMGSCTPEAPAEFRIGLLALSDPVYVESSGEPSIRGAELAALEINQAGGLVLDGRHFLVRIVVGGYPARADAAMTAARALLNQDSVHVLIGPQLSDHAIPVAVIAEAEQVPMISPMSSNPATTAGKQYVSRLAFLDEAQGGALAAFAVDSLGAERAALLYDESMAYSRSVSERFRRGFEEAGGRVVAEETYTSDKVRTFEDQLRRIRRSQPDVLLLPNATKDDSIQIREARELGIEAVFLGGDRWDLQRMVSLPEAQGSFITHQWLSGAADREAEAFVARFHTEYGRQPRSTAAMTYDAVKVMVEAASRAGTTSGLEIARSVRGIEGYRGATGSISFGESGDPDRSVALSTIRDGRIVSLRLLDF